MLDGLITNEISLKVRFRLYYRFKSNQVSNRILSDLHLVFCISHSDNLNLIKILDMIEVKQALFSTDSTKTSGPDGCGAGFFKHYWNLIKHDFYLCISEFFIHGKMLRQINHTLIP